MGSPGQRHGEQNKSSGRCQEESANHQHFNHQTLSGLLIDSTIKDLTMRGLLQGAGSKYNDLSVFILLAGLAPGTHYHGVHSCLVPELPTHEAGYLL